MKKTQKISINKIYPELPPEKQAEAEFNLLAYLEVVRSIFERLEKEDPKLLTELGNSANLKAKKRKENN